MAVLTAVSVLLTLVPAPEPVRAAIRYFSAGGETGDISEYTANSLGECFTSPDGASSQPQAVTEQHHSGNWSCKFDLPNPSVQYGVKLDRWRTNAATGNTTFQSVGQALYYSAWYYIRAGFTQDLWANNMQWRQDIFSFYPTLFVGFRARNNVLQAYVYHPGCTTGAGVPCVDFPGYIRVGADYYQQNPKLIPRNQWFQIEARYYRAQTNGRLTVWQDGVQIFELTASNFNTSGSQATNSNNFQFEVNNCEDSARTGDQLLYVDDVKITDYQVGTGGTPTPTPTPTPIPTPTPTPTPTALPKVSTLTDNFDDNSLDTAKWSATQNTGYPLSETNSQIQVSNTTTDSGGGWLISVNNYDATASNLTVQLVDGGNCTNTSLNTWVDTRLQIDNSNNVQVSCNQNTLKAAHRVGGTFTMIASMAYNPLTMKWIRLREGGGATFYEYSLDRTTWTTLASEPNPISLTVVKVQLAGNAWPGPAGTVKVDNVNTLPSDTTPPSVPTSFSATAVSSTQINLSWAASMDNVNTGYLFKTGGTNWTPISYTSTEALMANAWYPKSANTTINLTSSEACQSQLRARLHLLMDRNELKCGCRDSACTQSYWQIQSFKR